MLPIEIGPARPVSAVDLRQPNLAAAPKPAREPTGAVALSATLDPGEPPVDTERVALIRRAIEQGRYPVLPFRVADAIIAAELLLRSGK